MAGLGVARLGDEAMLAQAGADLVVTTLDDVSRDALRAGALERRNAPADRVPRQREQPPGTWSFAYEGFDPESQGLREALCALGNGYFVTRGALPEATADDVNYPGQTLACITGCGARWPYCSVENEDLVNVPNWLSFRFRPVDHGSTWAAANFSTG